MKAKLWSIFGKNGGSRAVQLMKGLNELYPPSAEDVPTTPKFIRLGFHDCLKYADGSGGCDGCLNWHNMGHRFPPTADQRENAFRYKLVVKSQKAQIYTFIGISANADPH